MEKRHRVFIAINLPEDVKKQLFAYSEKWPELPAKWTAKDNLHITLEFLGDLTDVEIADACKVVGEVAKNHNYFSINLSKVLYGPPQKKSATPLSGAIGTLSVPKMVWADGEKSEELMELKKDLQEYLLEKIAFRPEINKGFIVHITLAKILETEFRKFDLDERPEVNEDIDLVFSVESIEVVESELKRGGPVYIILESHILGN